MTPLSELLPQAEPMILLSGYEPSATPGTATAFVDISPTVPFYDFEVGGVPACVALEYMAQAIALAVGLSRRAAGEAPRLGFVLGSRKFETVVEVFKSGCRYRVTAVNTYQDESFGSFDCEVIAPDSTCAARASLTAFQPTGEMTPERLKDYE